MRVTSALEPLGSDSWRVPSAALLLGASTAWAAALWLAPCALASRAGSPVEHTLFVVPYVAGRTVCHQEVERSFTVCGVRQPVCARCTGLYLGAPLGLALAVMRRRSRGGAQPSASADAARRALVWTAAPTFASVLLEWLHLAQPGNATRCLLAVPLGTAVGWVVARALLGQLGGRLG